MSRLQLTTRPTRLGFAGRSFGIVAAALALLAAAWLPAPASANDLIVRYDQSQLLRLPRQVSEIIIGNPSIADVSVQGGNMLVITGKTFGITNIIALDSERNVIQDQRIVVERDERRVVNVNKAGLRQSFSCTPNCSPNLTIGDDPVYFEQVLKSASSKTKFSDASSEGAGGSPANQ